MKVLVLGAGKMIESILKGLHKTEDLSEWHIYSPSGKSATSLAALVGAKSITNLKEIDNVDWVFVGCKPQQLKDLSVTLNGLFTDAIFISILAAISEQNQKKILGVSKLVRAMPNLPVAINEGITLLASESVESDLDSFQKFFAKLGTSLVVNESELEELTLLTGSGPAFVYEFSNQLSKSFESLSDDKREELTKQLLKGAAMTAHNSDKSLAQLRAEVTSKGGVTQAVLESWTQSSLNEILRKGISAGKKRILEINGPTQN
jgi:pyrroline-5-carboxylate reductase